MLPIPHVFQEGFASDVVARQTHFLQLPLDDDLRRDAGVVCSWQPQRVEATHAVVARQGVHHRVVKAVPHVQGAGDIGRRELD